MKTILISAYACEPGKGSEPGVGWNWSKEISKNNKVIVLTRKNNQNAIETELQAHPNSNMEFVYYDVPRTLTFWKKGQRGVQLYYSLWQAGAYKVAKKIVREKNVDFAFALTFGNMWLPTFMYKLPCKFIWGPLGGGEGIPKILWSHISFKQKVYEYFRCINPHIAITNVWFRRACKKASAIIVRTNESLQCIPKVYRNKCSIMIETGVEEAECKSLNDRSLGKNKTKDFTIVGRLIPLKFVDIGIRAFAGMSDAYKESMLHIVGDGECQEELEKLASELNINDRVIFHGKMQRDATLQIISQSLALIMPSAKEGGAWVLFEAMMCAKPIICMDTTGMSLVVSSKTGIKVPVCTYSRLVDSFAEAMKKLLQDETIAKIMGEEGYQRVLSEFLWVDKGIFFESILENLSGGEQNKNLSGA